MHIIISIDDTDNLDSRGTGELAAIIANFIDTSGYGTSKPVSRHQLLIHEDIPYTSHNSAMSFEAEVNKEYINNIISYSENFLEKESAEGSDPGLCVAQIDSLKDKEKLIDFGFRAKKVVLTKKDAYDLAKELNIHLSEHGGTGQGIIGALAGAGLRLSGNDGKFRGSHKIEAVNNLIKVSEILSYDNIHSVKSLEGEYIDNNEIIMLKDKVKTVIIDGKSVLLVDKVDNPEFGAKWVNCSKQQIKSYEELRCHVVS